jgi:hypothetical protein
LSTAAIRFPDIDFEKLSVMLLPIDKRTQEYKICGAPPTIAVTIRAVGNAFAEEIFDKSE